jgi:hypothetical protein
MCRQSTPCRSCCSHYDREHHHDDPAHADGATCVFNDYDNTDEPIIRRDLKLSSHFLEVSTEGSVAATRVRQLRSPREANAGRVASAHRPPTPADKAVVLTLEQLAATETERAKRRQESNGRAGAAFNARLRAKREVEKDAAD